MSGKTEKVARISTRRIRVSYADPYATDSSSGEEAESGVRRREKRKVHEIILNGVESPAKKSQSLPCRSENRERGRGICWVPVNGFVGVRCRRPGRFSAEIRDPFKKKRVWLGTFNSAEEAYNVYMAKKREFEEKRIAKQGLNRVPVGLESPDSVLEAEEPESCSSSSSSSADGESHALEVVPDAVGVDEHNAESGGNEEEISFEMAIEMQIIDRNGFLVGEYSKLDDLSIVN